ncbi:MAG TPA: penicillin-binding protein activator [Gammaproteobacteria bacterium]|nr:penicillin-binding protein activator [Gammaproteobacteria bacterium]
MLKIIVHGRLSRMQAALRNPHAGRVLVVALGLLLGACETARIERPAPDAERAASRAERHFEEGEFAAAAAIYEQLAERAPAAQRNAWRVSAARARWAAGDVEGTRANLDAVEGELTPAEQRLWAPLAARVDIARGQPERALERLAALPRKLPEPLLSEVLELEGRALFRAGQPLRAIEVLVEREARLDDASDVLANHRLIWNSLLEMPAANLPSEDARAADPVVAGWLSLGRLAHESGRSPFGFRTALRNWREAHANHPASEAGLLDDILRSVRTAMTYPQQIALLLPQSGREAAAAAALRDGFLAAYFAHEADAGRPLVQIYDVAGRDASSIYRQAVLDGADFVVGPLTKISVEAVADVAGEVPTLALNYLPDDRPAPASFFQFALAPEDEARQAARRALADGRRRALAFVPNSDWGMRVLRSFASELESEGGVLLDFRAYDTGASDFSEPIVRLLQLDESQRRHARLERVLGTPLAFQPQPRQDVDFLFLATTAEHGRLIRPQLRFHFAADLPVYATSAAYDPGRAADSDLNGIKFADMPWTIAPDAAARALKDTLHNFWPTRADRWSRLYAMGFDAYRLVPLLHNQAEPLAGTVPGMTGVLSMDDAGRIHRDLEWAEFRAGKPHELASAPPLPPPDR